MNMSMNVPNKARHVTIHSSSNNNSSININGSSICCCNDGSD